MGKRIIELINKIRSSVDDKLQKPTEEQPEGHVRIFIPSNHQSKIEIEMEAAKQMAEITQDFLWRSSESDVKVLILEHHMAAKRIGFETFFTSLYGAESLRTGLLDGSNSGIRFFTRIILPIVNALRKNDKFAITHIVKSNSPFFTNKRGDHKEKTLKEINAHVSSLLSLWETGKNPTLIEIVRNIGDSGLFILPDMFEIIYSRSATSPPDVSESNQSEKDKNTANLHAWDLALAVNFNEVEKYNEYTAGNARFGTHQGVKGLEFDRVMVIVDDDDAKGFSFSYSALFTGGTIYATQKEKPKADEISVDWRFRSS